MVQEARLEQLDSGLAPVSEGWFTVNAADAAWVTNDVFGARCVFEANRPVLRNRPEQPVRTFSQLGLGLAVFEPGQPAGLYHSESAQEDFLVLAGECLLIVEDEVRPLRAWDFFHCPPGTAHAFVGAGVGPCVLFMSGARSHSNELVYPRSDAAVRRGVGVAQETRSAHEAYGPYPHWGPGRPEHADRLPWSLRTTAESQG